MRFKIGQISTYCKDKGIASESSFIATFTQRDGGKWAKAQGAPSPFSENGAPCILCAIARRCDKCMVTGYLSQTGPLSPTIAIADKNLMGCQNIGIGTIR